MADEPRPQLVVVLESIVVFMAGFWCGGVDGEAILTALVVALHYVDRAGARAVIPAGGGMVRLVVVGLRAESIEQINADHRLLD